MLVITSRTNPGFLGDQQTMSSLATVNFTFHRDPPPPRIISPGGCTVNQQYLAAIKFGRSGSDLVLSA